MQAIPFIQLTTDYVLAGGSLLRVQGDYLYSASAPVGQIKGDLAYLIAGTEATNILQVLAKFGADGHMWIPGIGVIDGITANNWANTGGTVPATVGGTVARVNEYSGSFTATQSTGASQPILRENKYRWEFDGTDDHFTLPYNPFNMSHDFCIVAGASLSSSGVSRSIYGQSNNSNHVLPDFGFNSSGQLGISAVAGATSMSAYGGSSNAGGGPITAAVRVVAGAVEVQRNGLQVAATTAPAIASLPLYASIGALPKLTVEGYFAGSIYPVVVIRGAVSDSDFTIIKQFVDAWASPIIPVLTVSSTNGIAPFGVVVDGVQTTSLDPNIRPLRDLVYFFRCSDPNMGNYDNGELTGQPRNKFLGGPVAAFTLVTPGTHTIEMWVSDGIRVWQAETKTITIQDPDVVFAGSLTTVVSTSGDFTGAPVGANQVTSSDFDAQVLSGTVSGSNKRVLFRVGETFQSSAAGTFNTRTNYHVGIFGTGASYVNGKTYATVQAVANGINPMFGGSTTSAAQNNDYVCAWGLHFTRTLGGGVTGGVALASGNKPDTVSGVDYTKGNFTYHMCKASNIVALGSAIGGYNVIYSQCVAENTNEGISVAGGIGIYMDEIIRGAVVDCLIDCNNGGEHCLRRQGGNYFTSISNTLRRPASTKSFLTIRGWQGRNAGTQVTSRYNQASYNKIDGSTNGSVASFLGLDIAPQNATAYEPIADSIIESNFVYSHNINFSCVSRVQALSVTYRNNAHYFGTQTTSSFYGVQISGPSTNTAGADDCEFINNSFHSVSLATGFSAFNKAATAPSTNRIYNTVAYAPNATRDGTGAGGTPTLCIDPSGNIIAANNSSNAQIKSTDPLYNGATTSMSGFKLQAGSPYKNFGADYKVRVDAFGYLKGAPTPDAGALNSIDKQVDAWTLLP